MAPLKNIKRQLSKFDLWHVRRQEYAKDFHKLTKKQKNLAILLFDVDDGGQYIKKDDLVRLLGCWQSKIPNYLVRMDRITGVNKWIEEFRRMQDVKTC